MYVCKYCGKEVGNKGALVLHERKCIQNPNYTNYSKTQLIAIERNSRRDDNGKIYLRKEQKPITEEQRKHLSEKRKEWLRNHKDEHVWKRNSKFISKPCEILKKFLKDKNINFVEEYQPFDDINYSLDIAWPDEKIAIEVNGNQHYNKDGTLAEYYQKRHNILEERGWRIFEIHYTKCYNINIDNFSDILKLPIYDKDYVKKYFSRKELKYIKKLKYKENKQKEKEIEYNKRKEIIYNLIINSNIDFTKFGWVGKSVKYLKDRNELWSIHIREIIEKYFPNYMEQNNFFIRKI